MHRRGRNQNSCHSCNLARVNQIECPTRQPAGGTPSEWSIRPTHLTVDLLHVLPPRSALLVVPESHGEQLADDVIRVLGCVLVSDPDQPEQALPDLAHHLAVDGDRGAANLLNQQALRAVEGDHRWEKKGMGALGEASELRAYLRQGLLRVG